jgi:hypothetical protein
MADGRNLERGAGPPRDAHLGDEIVDLVLGDVDADRRAAMAAHLMRCAACRGDYDDLTATMEDLLPAVPAVQPPLGFDERVLARLPTGAGAAGAGSSPRRGRWLAVAAAVLVVVLVPLGVWAATRDSAGGTAGTAGELATLHRTRDDATVGTVSISDVDGAAVAVVALVGAPADVAYYCRMRFADGSTVDSEAWPAGNGAWIVPLPTADVTTVEVLPAGTEKVWSTATFT